MSKITISIIMLVVAAIVYRFIFKKDNPKVEEKKNKENIIPTLFTDGKYGERVRYDEKTRITFPDFSLQYLGQGEEPGPSNADWKMIFKVFKISKNYISNEVYWSDGAGVFKPIPFDFNGRKYTIEMSMSEKFGHLSKDEVVINQQN